ncbi:hypothetical protein LOAG_12014 [Loa loa]|uniref:Uncharacterized protein n=1 Tax=Loa loa TaxID=7209 RepID=A0A1S0TM07_LOALO|nr:hypothetical protein LOAG_12014 [Loa loa]EFO16493.1 hypothetical protein LOAG_12014 [Loa loa]
MPRHELQFKTALKEHIAKMIVTWPRKDNLYNYTKRINSIKNLEDKNVIVPVNNYSIFFNLLAHLTANFNCMINLNLKEEKGKKEEGMLKFEIIIKMTDLNKIIYHLFKNEKKEEEGEKEKEKEGKGEEKILKFQIFEYHTSHNSSSSDEILQMSTQNT